MEVMFDKAFVSGAMSTAGGPVDLTEGMEGEKADTDELGQQEDLGDTSESIRQRKNKGKRGRTSSTNLDGSPYYNAYKSALDKWVTSTKTT